MAVRRWLAPAVALALAAAAAWPVRVLEFRNDDRGTARRFLAGPGRSFSVTYRHSLYDQPVTEDFTVGPGGGLTLTALRSPSGAVLEYFGFPDSRASRSLARPLGTVVFRVAEGVAQELEIGRRRLSFLDLGDHGDRLVLRTARAPLGVLGWDAARRHFGKRP